MHPELQRRFYEIENAVRGYHPGADLPLLERAFQFAEQRHEGQQRKSGEPYILHPVEVSGIAADMRLDIFSLCAALLHDTVEDTDTKIEEIRDQFGEQVAFLVGGLTKISKIEFRSKEQQQAENIRKLIVAMSRDVRVVLIKLADRLHNMRTLQHMSESGQQRIAQETLDIYAPLANRLGINWIKVELEDTAFRYVNPEGYADLISKIEKSQAERDAYIRETAALLKSATRERGIDGEIMGRPKHLWSIHRKMVQSRVEFEQIYDLTAFRILVPDAATCYEALGLVHSLWPPVPGRFKDFIAVPKPNGYSSLHTTVVGPRGERIEIQIRTQEMHRIAEHGVAAHWAYKEGRSSIDLTGSQFSWLKELVHSLSEIKDSRELLESVKLDLFQDEVFVFTPRGDIKGMPQGATPLDFAYAVHTDVGNHCVLAKVNGRVVNLRHELKNGDIVEIVTRADQSPREEWLDFVKTAGARAKIRAVIRTAQKEKAREVARGLLTAELRKYNLRYESLQKKGDLAAVAELLHFQSVEQMLLDLGYGKIQTDTIVQKLIPPDARPVEERPASPVRKFGEKLLSLVSKQETAAVRIAGMEGDPLVTFARCCNPIAGEEITGFVTRGRGIVVHSANCPKAINLEPERLLPVEWTQTGPAGDDAVRRRVTLKVVCRDGTGLLAEMSKALSARGLNIAQAHCRAGADGYATNLFDVLVRNLGQLNEAIKQVQKIDGVVTVERVQG